MEDADKLWQGLSASDTGSEGRKVQSISFLTTQRDSAESVCKTCVYVQSSIVYLQPQRQQHLQELSGRPLT